VNRDSGAEVTFDAVVLTEPRVSGREQRFDVRSGVGDQLEVDNDIDYGTQAPLAAGDHIIVKGQLYLDPDRTGVHCTHQATSSGCPLPGFIEYAGKLYQ
jgi:hypothetical protein